MRHLLATVAVALFVLAGLDLIDGQWPRAIVLMTCSIIAAIAREKF